MRPESKIVVRHVSSPSTFDGGFYAQPDHGRHRRQCGRQAILDGIRKRWPWMKHLFADGAYDRLKLMDKAAYLDFVIEIMAIRRPEVSKSCPVAGWSSEPSAG